MFPVWDVLWVALVWLFYILAWCGALIVAFAVLVGLARVVKDWFKKPQTWQQIEKMSESRAILRYQDHPNADWLVDCYMAGVRDTIDVAKRR